MKLSYFAYLAFVGVLSFLMIFIVDREKESGGGADCRVSRFRTPRWRTRA